MAPGGPTGCFRPSSRGARCTPCPDLGPAVQPRCSEQRAHGHAGYPNREPGNVLTTLLRTSTFVPVHLTRYEEIRSMEMETRHQVTTPTAPASKKMRAIVQERYGLPDVLELSDVDRPEPDDHQVRIQVRGASLNMYDWPMTPGTPLLARIQAGLRNPKHAVAGADVAGVVEIVGGSVTRFAPGDEVFGFVGAGAFAEY